MSRIVSNITEFNEVVIRKWWLKSDHFMALFITF